MLIYGGVIMKGNVDGGESRKMAGAKYLEPVRRNRTCVQVKTLALDKRKDS